MFEGTDTILVIGAHPDDEVLGPGGTVAKHAASGDEVHLLILTEGTTQQYDNERLIDKKKRKQTLVLKLLAPLIFILGTCQTCN